ncbi:MAG: cyclase family protein [Geodermatophilaceae bacterium]|nr:cyclase family protein [Geodermatophilaceae bacterium]
MPFVDLSHVVTHGMTTYPGLPGPQLSEHMSFAASRERYAEGTEFRIGAIWLVANTGTYLDTPAHRFPDGHDLADLPLERCADLPVVVLDSPGPAIDADLLAAMDVQGAAVLFRTRWDRHWGTARYGDADHPYLTADAARALVDGGAALVGIDSVNIDATVGGERPVHTALLAAGIPVVEHLTRLGSVPGVGARFSAVPVPVQGMGTFPVRAYAIYPPGQPE